MKKIQFVELVLSHLARLGATEAELEKQKIQINSYLTNLGIGEEARELDYESPSDFAEECFKIIKAHRTPETDDIPTLEEPYVEEKDDVKVFGEEKNDDDLSELGEELEIEQQDYLGEEEYATREFTISDAEDDYYAEGDAEDDYYAEGDAEEQEEEEYIPSGNPVFFWIIAVVLSPLWVPLGILALAFSAILFALLSIFIVAYIPLLIAVILGGSCAIIAEIIFSIVKFIGGQIHIGIFELGLAFFIGAIMVSISVLIYRFGTKYATKVWRNYWSCVSDIYKKLKRLIRKFKGVCSI